MKWILIFSFLIFLVLFLIQKAAFFLSGINPKIVTPIVLIITTGLITFLLISKIKLYSNADLKDEITMLKGFYLLFSTCAIGVIVFLIYESYNSINIQDVPRRYYSGELNSDFIDSKSNWFTTFIGSIKRSAFLFLFMAIMSLIIAKIFSKAPPQY